MAHSLQKVAVVGSGYMGGGIAQVLAQAGATVLLADTDAATASRAYTRLLDQAAAFEQRGLFPPGAAQQIGQLMSAAPSIEVAVADADYITEAVPEIVDLKSSVLQRISAAARSDSIIGTNTSAIPIGDLAQWVVGPERFLGVHWMNPAPFVPGIELIPTAFTGADVIDAVEQLVRSAGKTPARISDSPGFVANRLQFALYKEAVRMVEEGLVTPEQVDLVVANAFGFRLPFFGPFAIGDMAGLDVYAASYESMAAVYGERLAAPKSLTDLVQTGHLGIKSGGGFLDIDLDQLPALLAYRDNAYAALSRLRAELGPPPGLSS